MTVTELVIFLSVVAVLTVLGKYLEIRSYRRQAKMFEDQEVIGKSLTWEQQLRYSTATSRLEHLKYKYKKGG